MKKEKADQMVIKNAVEGAAPEIQIETIPTKILTIIETITIEGIGKEDRAGARRRKQTLGHSILNRVSKLPISAPIKQADMV